MKAERGYSAGGREAGRAKRKSSGGKRWRMTMGKGGGEGQWGRDKEKTGRGARRRQWERGKEKVVGKG